MLSSGNKVTHTFSGEDMACYRRAGVSFSPAFPGRSEGEERKVRKHSFRGSARQPEDWKVLQNVVHSLVKKAREQ